MNYVRLDWLAVDCSDYTSNDATFSKRGLSTVLFLQIKQMLTFFLHVIVLNQILGNKSDLDISLKKLRHWSELF